MSTSTYLGSTHEWLLIQLDLLSSTLQKLSSTRFSLGTSRFFFPEQNENPDKNWIETERNYPELQNLLRNMHPSSHDAPQSLSEYMELALET